MRKWMNLVEKVVTMPVQTGWTKMTGERISADLKVWTNPVKSEFIAAIHSMHVMHGDPHFRGIAHGGNVWIWDAKECTHAGMLDALGFCKLGDDFDYSNPEFSFFQVWASRWEENDSSPLYVSYSHHGEALQQTVARRWPATFINGGAWMGTPE